MALVEFSHASPFNDKLKEASRLFTFTKKATGESVNVVIDQAWEQGGKGGTDIGFGASVYDASFLLSHWLNEVCDSDFLKGKTVVELGCGPGLFVMSC
jgi:hypothetical protein